MSGEKRRNIFLSVKEALNNIMKHAQASKVRVNIDTAGDKLLIVITDNGIGMDVEKLRRFGNGLNNMKRRMQSIHGDFKIECNQGTILYFELPI
jgi:signal transduction histidine kinase